MTKLVNILKKPVAVAGLLSVALASGVASADFNPKFYVGAGVDYNYYGKKDDSIKKISSTNSQKLNGMGIGPLLGVRLHENFGIEIGYTFNKKYKETATNLFDEGINMEYKGKVKNAYLDLVGFFPVADQLELIGGLGIGKLMVKGDSNINFSNLPAGVTIDSTVKIKNKMGARVKFGANYKVTDSIGLRLLASYQMVNNNTKTDSTIRDGLNVLNVKSEGKFIRSMTSIGLAATYTF